MTITKPMKEKMAGIAREHGIALFVLFGSQATGQANKKSDIDLAYSSREPLPLDKESALAVALFDVFKTSHIDLVNLSIASPLLLKQITEKGTVLFEAKSSLFEELFLYARKVYRESARLRELERDEVLRHIRQYKKELSHA